MRFNSSLFIETTFGRIQLSDAVSHAELSPIYLYIYIYRGSHLFREAPKLLWISSGRFTSSREAFSTEGANQTTHSPHEPKASSGRPAHQGAASQSPAPSIAPQAHRTQQPTTTTGVSTPPPTLFACVLSSSTNSQHDADGEQVRRADPVRRARMPTRKRLRHTETAPSLRCRRHAPRARPPPPSGL